MNKTWTIKVIYGNDGGGYIHRDDGAKAVSYPSRQHAQAACEVLNAVNRQPGLFYLPVESEI